MADDLRPEEKGTLPDGEGESGRADGAGKTDRADRIDRIVDLFFESGMLRETPRSGWAFLGSGGEDVAQHSFRVALMSFVLAKMAGADPSRAAVLGLFHDLHEARTADLNYLQQRYVTADKDRAQADAVAGTGVEDDVMGAYREFEERETPEARLAKDADQLDLLFNLKVELDRGNDFAADWIDAALKRLKTPEAREIAGAMLESDHNRWWYGRVDRRWWIDRRDPRNESDREGPLRRGVRRGRGCSVRFLRKRSGEKK